MWDENITFRGIINKYLSYVGSRYIQCTVVFDGYCGGLSTKDHEHLRRSLKSSVSLDMAVQLDNSIGETIQKSSLANPRNKESLIDLLSYALSSNNQCCKITWGC